MTIQTQSDNGRDGDNYTVLRGRRDILRNSDVGAIFLSRQSSGVVGEPQRGGRRRRELPVHPRAEPQRVPREVVHAGRERRRDVRQRLDRLERQFPAHAVLAAERRRQFPRRHRLHQADRHPQAFRRLRHPLPARVVAEVRHPRAAPAHALQHLHRPVEREGVAHQSRGDGVVLREGRLSGAAVEPAVRADHRAVQGPAGSVVRAGPVRLERIRVGAGDEPQPEGVGLGAADRPAASGAARRSR